MDFSLFYDKIVGCFYTTIKIWRREHVKKMFKLKENNTTAKTEVIAGITTFMTMAYILT